jgi:hypothetical protein
MIRTLVKSILWCVLLIGGTPSSLSHAATNGILDTTSTGTSNIALTNAGASSPEIQISGLEDFHFGNVAVTETPTPMTISSICVYLSSASSYTLQISGVNPNPAAISPIGYLTPSNPTSPDRQYRYSFVAPNGVTVEDNAVYGGLSGSSTPSCNSVDMASLTISPLSITTDVINEVWTGTMTLTVTPE